MLLFLPAYNSKKKKGLVIYVYNPHAHSNISVANNRLRNIKKLGMIATNKDA
jgi:hypothetical protein